MTPPPFHDAALVIAGHGSTLNPDSSAPTHEHAAEIRRKGIFSEVVTCFWKEEPSYREVLRMVDSRDVYVVPNFISEGYFTGTIIPREMGLEGPVTRRGEKTIRYCAPAGSHDRMTSLLVAEAASVAPDVPPSETSLLIVGHGTGLNDNSAVAAKLQVRRISELGIYAEVLSCYMEEPPLIAEWDSFTTQPNVVVVPFFISDGLHSYQDIPVLLGISESPGAAASQTDVFRHNPHDLRGRKLFYGGAIGTDPGFADIIIDQAVAFDAAGEQRRGCGGPDRSRRWTNGCSSCEAARMTSIPDILSAAWENREPPAVLATTGPDGAPNAIYVSLVGRFDERTFFIANCAFNKTKHNILAGSRAALLFITRDRKAYQLKGRIALEASGAVFEEMQKITLPEHPAESAAVLRVEEVYSGADRLV